MPGERPRDSAIERYYAKKAVKDADEKARLVAIAEEDSHQSRDPRADRIALERAQAEKKTKESIDKTIEIPLSPVEAGKDKINNLKIDVISGSSDDGAEKREKDKEREIKRLADIAKIDAYIKDL